MAGVSIGVKAKINVVIFVNGGEEAFVGDDDIDDGILDRALGD